MRIALLLIFVVSMLGCGSEPGSDLQSPVLLRERDSGKFTFVVIVPGGDTLDVDAFEETLMQTAERSSQDYGDITIEMNVVPPRGASAWMEAINKAVEQKVDGIAIWGDGSNEMDAFINMANFARIPVITLGVDAPDSKRQAFYGPHVPAVAARLADLAVTEPDRALHVVAKRIGEFRTEYIDAFMERATELELTIDDVKFIMSSMTHHPDVLYDLSTETPLPETFVLLDGWLFSAVDSPAALERIVELNVVTQGPLLVLADLLEQGVVDRAVVWRETDMARETLGMLLALASGDRTIPVRNRARLIPVTKDNFRDLLDTP